MYVKHDKCKGFHHMFPPYTPSAAAALQKLCLSFLYQKVKRKKIIIIGQRRRNLRGGKTWWKNVVETTGWKKKWNPTRIFPAGIFCFFFSFVSTSTTLTPPLFHHINTPPSTILSTLCTNRRSVN